MKRTESPELLDTDAGTAAEIAMSLADLRRINCWFGGVSTTQALVARAFAQLQAKSLSLLEVAGGAGYVPAEVQRRLQSRGLRLEITLLDRAASHLRNGSGIPALAGDALALPFRDNSFDLVDCNLFVHHLSPRKVVEFANEALRVCRAAVLINDLIRHSAHLALIYAGMPLFRGRITRHDSIASVRQAYTVEEMRILLGKTCAASFELKPHYLFRMGVIAWKNSVSTGN